MSKVRSEYLGMEFEAETNEYGGAEKTINIIKHESLEDIIHNQLPDDIGVMYDYNIAQASPEHVVVVFTICDKKTGRRIQAIGESTVSSLETSIAKMYPALIASQRAFDRGVIRYLNIPGRVCSDIEANENGASAAPENAYAPACEISASVESDTPQIGKPAPISVENETAAIEQESTGPAETPSDEIAAIGSIVITMGGKYSGKGKTIAELYEEDRIWFNSIAAKLLSSPKESVQHEADMIRRYKELKEN